jgi:hypothetical protein
MVLYINSCYESEIYILLFGGGGPGVGVGGEQLPRKNRTTTRPEPRANTHGGQCFFPSELSPDFYLKKTLATNNKGVFNLRSPKSDSNSFLVGGCRHIYVSWLQF